MSDCATCNDTGSVCEQHLLPWPDGCGCSPGMPCPHCDRFEVAQAAVEVIARTGRYDHRMTEPVKRQVPIREWSCPNHDYPVDIGEEDAEHPWEALPQTAALLDRLGPEKAGDAWVEFGMCCRDAEWVTTGWVVPEMEDLLLGDPMLAAIRSQFEHNAFLTAMFNVQRDTSDSAIRIPLLFSPE